MNEEFINILKAVIEERWMNDCKIVIESIESIQRDGEQAYEVRIKNICLACGFEIETVYLHEILVFLNKEKK